jgi:hypothetical protein
MRRATITIDKDVAQALDAYVNDQEAAPALTAVVQAALRSFLAERGYLPARRTPKVTPAPRGSGKRAISVEHDKYFAER